MGGGGGGGRDVGRWAGAEGMRAACVCHLGIRNTGGHACVGMRMRLAMAMSRWSMSSKAGLVGERGGGGGMWACGRVRRACELRVHAILAERIRNTGGHACVGMRMRACVGARASRNGRFSTSSKVGTARGGGGGWERGRGGGMWVCAGGHACVCMRAIMGMRVSVRVHTRTLDACRCGGRATCKAAHTDACMWRDIMWRADGAQGGAHRRSALGFQHCSTSSRKMEGVARWNLGRRLSWQIWWPSSARGTPE